VPTTNGTEMKVYMIKSKKAPKTANIAVIDVIGGAGLFGLGWHN